jgi:hypothetical protein
MLRRLTVAALIVATALFGLYVARVPILRQIGAVLIHSDPLVAVDVVVVTLDSGSAGALEAGDLVRSGAASRVAVFHDPPRYAADLELVRRGLPYDDRSARQMDLLTLLGVRNVLRIPVPVSGTTDEVNALPSWCLAQGFRSVMVVATSDHSYRLHRALVRSTNGQRIGYLVRPSRYSAFDPDSWWTERTGVRIAMVELQKLLLDFVMYPMPI